MKHRSQSVTVAGWKKKKKRRKLWNTLSVDTYVPLAIRPWSLRFLLKHFLTSVEIEYSEDDCIFMNSVRFQN